MGNLGSLAQAASKGNAHWTASSSPKVLPTVTTPPSGASTFDSYSEARDAAVRHNQRAAGQLNAWQARVREVVQSNRREMASTNQENRRNYAEAVVNFVQDKKQSIEEMKIERAVRGHSTALEMTGNPGQLAIINGLGQGAFSEVSEAYTSDDGDEAEYFNMGLQGRTEHPEAVEQILSEASQVMADTEADPVMFERPRVRKPQLRPIPKMPKVQVMGAGRTEGARGGSGGKGRR